jgi:adenylate cyclase
MDTLELLETTAGIERLVRVIPIRNEKRCYVCHGSKHTVRAAIEVSTSMAEINDRIQSNTVRSIIVGLVTLGLVWLVLRLFMRSVVIRPIQLMEAVAARVGSGDLTARTDLTSSDEIGSLAGKLNDMVRGLRERFKLEKFVSRQTIDAVRLNDAAEVGLGGVRKTATMFFTDIRGFTSFSERTEPEHVVAMLNRTLTVQAGIVRRHGGDIDKYVGDELVAVFEGEEMADRALRAAIDIQRELPPVLEAENLGAISIGIGINAGEVVMGAMGSPDRMDFTVIGDAVNLGARLCSAADGGCILLSETVRSMLIDASRYPLRERSPLRVKGKSEPIHVFEIRTVDQQGRHEPS